VLREGEPEPFDVTITRETITISAVRSRVEGDAVVLRLTTFNEQTFPNLEAQIAEQIEAAGGMDKIAGFVLDLRNNPGGLLDQAIKVSDAFLESGEIVSTRGRDPADADRYNATAGDLTEGKPLVVLINGGSASASEIVAGALQDHRRAMVVGTQSFGKGSVQTIIPVQQDGAMRLTTARYYTPSGRSIQALGVAPDVIVEQRTPEEVAAEQAEDEAETGAAALPTRSEADLRGSLENDSLTEDERKQLEVERARREEIAVRREEDYQLAYAIDVLDGLAFLNGGAVKSAANAN
jgi:carboxyl-terminal processing protease